LELQLSTYSIQLKPIAESLTSFLARKQYSRIFVLVDENTKEHCLPKVAPILPDVTVIEIKSGEQHKNIDTCQHIWQSLMLAGADRNSLMINLGGGVIGDMGGFAAATFKRGINFIQIPTTLLAQVDASIGGKLGVDFSGIKNSIGLFSNPQTVLIDERMLPTLPKAELWSGFAEMLKHGMLSGHQHLEQIMNIDPTTEIPTSLIKSSLQVKKAIVASDPYEKGIRKILNWGHSLGHAVESHSLFHSKTPLLHGEAIAIGMVVELYLSEKLMGFPIDQMHKISKYLLAKYPSYFYNKSDIPMMLDYLTNDKKNKNGELLFTLLKEVGIPVFDIPITSEQAQEALEFYMEVAS